MNVTYSRRNDETIGVKVIGHEDVYVVANVTPHQSRRATPSSDDFSHPDFSNLMKPRFYRVVETVIVNREEITEEEWRAAGGLEQLDYAPF
jgi:hypothetical protein